MSKFSVIDPRVQEMLEQFPELRENDHLLYATYLEEYHFLELNKDVFINYEEYKVPPFSTIERSARDIKLKYPNLRGKASNQQKRKQAEAEYKKHYVGG